MDTIRNILVPVDFSASSACAFIEAARLSTATGATLRAVHVVDARLVSELERVLESLEEPVRPQLERDAHARWESFVGDHPAHNVTFEVVVGNRLPSLLKQVNEHSIDLLIMGMQGQLGPDVGTGPLAAACARQAEASVLLMKTPHSGTFERILACVDFSEGSSQALDTAVAIAGRDRATLSAVHVFESRWNQLECAPTTDEPLADVARRYRESLQKRLSDFCARHVSSGQKKSTECHVLDHASAGVAVADYARRIKADLIVVGAHSLKYGSLAWIGSTAERLLQEAPCSVLISKTLYATRGNS